MEGLQSEKDKDKLLTSNSFLLLRLKQRRKPLSTQCLSMCLKAIQKATNYIVREGLPAD